MGAEGSRCEIPTKYGRMNKPKVAPLFSVQTFDLQDLEIVPWQMVTGMCRMESQNSAEKVLYIDLCETANHKTERHAATEICVLNFATF